MTHIPIPITKIGDAPVSGTFITSLFGTLVFGIFLGALSANITLVTSPEVTESNLAGVGATLSPDEADIVTVSDLTQSASEENPSVIAEEPGEDFEFIATADELPIPDTTPLSFVATTEETAESRDRLTNEIEQIKNESVALIAEFRTNCGVWTDECAIPYKTRLERNNARYEELERLLRAVQ